MRPEGTTPMAEMSPEDLEKLRRLEAEVDAEREAAKKRREALEQKALIAAEPPLAEKTLPAKKDEESSSLVTEKDASAWKRGLQKKIAVGAGGVMLAYWLMSNLLTIVAGVAVVGGAYYLSGKYLNPSTEDSSKKKKKDGEDE